MTRPSKRAFSFASRDCLRAAAASACRCCLSAQAACSRSRCACCSAAPQPGCKAGPSAAWLSSSSEASSLLPIGCDTPCSWLAESALVALSTASRTAASGSLSERELVPISLRRWAVLVEANAVLDLGLLLLLWIYLVADVQARHRDVRHRLRRHLVGKAPTPPGWQKSRLQDPTNELSPRGSFDIIRMGAAPGARWHTFRAGDSTG